MEYLHEQSEIPVLPGHSKRAWKSLFIRLSLMILGLALFGFGVYRESSSIQITGGFVGLIGFIGMIVSLGQLPDRTLPDLLGIDVTGMGFERAEIGRDFHMRGLRQFLADQKRDGEPLDRIKQQGEQVGDGDAEEAV